MRLDFLKHKFFRMKKVLAVFLSLIAFEYKAQDIKSKKGENYLPEAKDYAIQIDAVPFLNYTGKLLSNAGSTSPDITSPNFSPLTIGGKYFVTNKYAYRAKFRIATGSETLRNTVINNEKSTTKTIYTNDTRKTSETNISLTFGFEKRKGNTRLQGYYGAEGLLKIVGGNTKYSYGNAFTATNPSVYTTDFDKTTASGFESALQTQRVTSIKEGTTIGIGARGFIGAEYFIFPKISIGAELGWGFAYLNKNDGLLTVESWNATAAIKEGVPFGGGSYFGIDTDNSGGQLMLTLHF